MTTDEAIKTRTFDYKSILNELAPILLLINFRLQRGDVRAHELKKSLESFAASIKADAEQDQNYPVEKYILRPFTFFDALAKLSEKKLIRKSKIPELRKTKPKTDSQDDTVSQSTKDTVIYSLVESKLNNELIDSDIFLLRTLCSQILLLTEYND